MSGSGEATGGGGEGYRAGREDGPLKCTWSPGTKAASPHPHYRSSRGLILENVLEAIGQTPMVRLNRIPAEAGLACDLLAKCEFFNAGGSVKDRIGKRMVEDAEKSGRIKPGDTLIEPTSGNTGIGIALAAAVKGYRCIITLPEKMSHEKVAVLKALGAEIVRTPTEAAFDSPESHIGVAKRLNAEIPNSHILDQYSNPSNPLAHYDETAEEILEQCGGKVDMVVIGAGTGGTITGVARKIKERCPECEVVGVDPVGSILAEPDSLNDKDRLRPYLVEGTGYDFIPAVLDRSIVDRWVKTGDEESLIMARRLIREEGILSGGSSGGSVAGALKAAKDLPKGAKCVVILPDSIRNYLSKMASDDWMWEHGFVDEARGIGAGRVSGTALWWEGKTVADLSPAAPVSVAPDILCQAAVDILAGEGFDQLPVVGADGAVLGVVTEGNLTSKLMSGRAKPEDTVESVMFAQFRTVAADTPLADLARIFDKDHYAIVTSSSRVITSGGPSDRAVVTGVVTRIDLLKYITHSAPKEE